MRFSVECAFPHLRKRDVTSRKSALWPRCLTEKRTLTYSSTVLLTKRRTFLTKRRTLWNSS